MTRKRNGGAPHVNPPTVVDGATPPPPPPTHVMFKAEIPLPIKRVLELEPKLILLIRDFLLTEKIGPYAEALKDMDSAVQGSSGDS